MCFFHLYLNILAEITKFADREFYRDWWNATDLGYFWSNWNMPVHNWIAKHIYQVLLHAGVTRDFAIFVCFCVSAVFHELIISVPFHTMKLWAFFGIMVQLPLIKLSRKYLSGKNMGNVIFWFSIVLGQPFCVLMYFRDYFKSLEAVSFGEHETIQEFTHQFISPSAAAAATVFGI